MTNYRIYKVSTFTSSSAWTKLGAHDNTNSYNKAWGIMTHVGMATSGSVTVEGGGDLYLQHSRSTTATGPTGWSSPLSTTVTTSSG